MFAPAGGQNLAPRQFERQWKGGRPNDANLAQMAAEYRQKFPDKAVINDFGQGAWAYVCAGGSLPNLPRSTDAKLLAEIPQMKPWFADSAKKIWALREPGKQILAYGSGELDLDIGSDIFRINWVDSLSGKVTRGNIMVQGDRTLILKGGVVWLTKE